MSTCGPASPAGCEVVQARRKTPVTLTSEEQSAALRIVVAELERVICSTGSSNASALADRFGPARWVHATIARSLADGMDQHLRVRVEAHAEGPGTAVFLPT
ncbi:hypothetical protein OG601_46670 [Streptomyces sp. NBC_01239]|uniref:hypothetical protein n=1 Tax=Streptomyces sp. NBC_01239 TaxID=2903792 RepID=UPI0022586432|nr:hypothetical protein [Streptomyces sp. NBC_01239]MCX4818059.1 hypothetical protein [Streptomyces sp. NBC_01239]